MNISTTTVTKLATERSVNDLVNTLVSIRHFLGLVPVVGQEHIFQIGLAAVQVHDVVVQRHLQEILDRSVIGDADVESGGGDRTNVRDAGEHSPVDRCPELKIQSADGLADQLVHPLHLDQVSLPQDPDPISNSFYLGQRVAG